MSIILIFADYELGLPTCQSLMLVGPGLVRTRLFGNDEVLHRNVKSVLTSDRHVIFEYTTEKID